MRLLVLGAGGQLGGELLAAAGRAGLDARGAARAEIDVADPDALRAFLAAAPFDALVNCTAFADTDAAERQADLAVAVNGEAPGVMAEACAARGARFLHVSTDYVFGGNAPGAGGAAAGRAPLAEDEPAAPVNVYGLSKRHGEVLAALSGGDVTVFRVAALFGLRGVSGRGGNFVETMIRVGRERGALKVVGDQVTSPTAAAFVVDAILGFLARGGAPGLYHCVNSGAASWADFARAIVAGAGVAAEVAPCSTAEWGAPARRPAWSALDNAKLAGLIGPIPSWQDALADYLRARGRQ